MRFFSGSSVSITVVSIGISIKVTSNSSTSSRMDSANRAKCLISNSSISFNTFLPDKIFIVPEISRNCISLVESIDSDFSFSFLFVILQAVSVSVSATSISALSVKKGIASNCFRPIDESTFRESMIYLNPLICCIACLIIIIYDLRFTILLMFVFLINQILFTTNAYSQ
ncbi:MAG: hypothetical protein BWZ00_01438 [Bacteroidetes bacterium ADurb.BinA174]|nr:MAG: hypothetical protein BWZ00_01438 [Bacteroidetes bacterium ADurb.BinA174]